jgi:TRAP-type uncharacterized transport system fused permease subunit
MRLASVAYVIPFVFAFQPALILVGGVGEIVLAVGTAAVGVWLVAIACAGYLFRPLGVARRAAAGAAGILLFALPAGGVWLAVGAVGLVGGLAFVLWEWNARPPAASAARVTMERA